MGDRIGQGDILPIMLGEFKTIRTTSFDLDFFLKGLAFSYTDYVIFGTDEVKNYVFDPTTYTPPAGSYGKIIARPPAIGATQGPILLDVYGNTDANNDGTIITAFNRNGNSPKPVSSATLRLNPTINNVGIKFAGYLTPSTGTNPITGRGGTAEDSLPYELNLTQKYLFRFTNLNGATTRVGIRSVWFEI